MSIGSKAAARIARAGYAARGVVFLAVGWSAIASTLRGIVPPTFRGALTAAGELPAGRVLLAAVALSLAIFAGWRLTEALVHRKRSGSLPTDLLLRGGMIVEGALSAGAALFAGTIAFGATGLIGGDGGNAAAGWTTALLEWPLGHWIVAVAGLGAVAMGFHAGVRALRGEFVDIGAGGRAKRVIQILGRIGLIAKGVIFALIGAILLLAAWGARSSPAGGLRGALQVLADLPIGNVAILAVSAGLGVYGVFNLIKAWLYRSG